MNDTESSYADTEAALRRLVSLYARAMDRNEPELLKAILTDDVAMEGPEFKSEGLDAALGFPANLQEMFLATQHVVHNLTFEVQGDTASGETYSTASHILPRKDESADEPHQALVWAIRYQDQFRRVDGEWRIAARTLLIDWTELRPVTFSS